MYLNEHIAVLKSNLMDLQKNLRLILKEHREHGFSKAVKEAGINRGIARSLIGTYDDTGPIRKMASKSCGLSTSKWTK